MGLERPAQAPISNDTQSNLTSDTDFKAHFWLSLYVLENLSEKGLWKHAQFIGCTQEAPQLRTRITHNNYC